MEFWLDCCSLSYISGDCLSLSWNVNKILVKFWLILVPWYAVKYSLPFRLCCDWFARYEKIKMNEWINNEWWISDSIRLFFNRVYPQNLQMAMSKNTSYSWKQLVLTDSLRPRTSPRTHRWILQYANYFLGQYTMFPSRPSRSRLVPGALWSKLGLWKMVC